MALQQEKNIVEIPFLTLLLSRWYRRVLSCMRVYACCLEIAFSYPYNVMYDVHDLNIEYTTKKCCHYTEKGMRDGSILIASKHKLPS